MCVTAPHHWSSEFDQGSCDIVVYTVYDLYSLKQQENYPFQNTIEVFLNRERILDYLLTKERELLGGEGTAVLNLFTMPWMVVTNNIENITFILKNVDTFGKGPEWTSRFDKLLGNGIFNADGAVWYKHRKTSAHLFKLNTFKHEMIDTFDIHCNELVQVIKTKNGKPFDIQVRVEECVSFSVLLYLPTHPSLHFPQLMLMVA